MNSRPYRNVATLAAIFLTLAVGGSFTQAQQSISKGKTITVDSTSGEAEIGLANHLHQIKAKIYGAYWCIHCYEQIYLFGQEAFKQIERIECTPGGENAQPELCRKAGVEGFPTWEINGKLYGGKKKLKELADLSRYRGVHSFKNKLPTKIPEGFYPRKDDPAQTIPLELLIPGYRNPNKSKELHSL
jgi:hypothetical protein